MEKIFFLFAFAALTSGIAKPAPSAPPRQIMVWRLVHVESETALTWQSEECTLETGATDEETAYAALCRLLETAACVPHGAEITGVTIRGGLLRLDMSPEAFEGGGADGSLTFAAQLLRTSLSLPNVEALTLTCGSRVRPLAEGLEIINAASWEMYYNEETASFSLNDGNAAYP